MEIVPIQVTEQGVLIPRVYLPNAEAVEAVLTAEYVLVRAKTEPVSIRPTTPSLADQLFGALGHGQWAEYDLEVDWQRFSV